MARLWITFVTAMCISSVFSDLNSIQNMDESCPIGRGFDTDDVNFKVLMTVLSGAENTPSSPDCQFNVSTPRNTNLYQVMTVGKHHFPQEFSFNYNIHPIGRMVECINTICNRHPYFWMVFNGTTNQLLPKGIDETYPEKDGDIVWKYIDVTSVTAFNNIEQYSEYQADEQDLKLQNDCQRMSPAISRSHIEVKLSAVNDRDPSWPPVCHLPVLAKFGDTLGHVLDRTQFQHPRKFTYTTKEWEYGHYVDSINGLYNDGEWNWLVFDPITGELLQTGFDDTFAKHHDHFIWRYTNHATHPSRSLTTTTDTYETLINIFISGWNYLFSLLSWSNYQ